MFRKFLNYFKGWNYKSYREFNTYMIIAIVIHTHTLSTVLLKEDPQKFILVASVFILVAHIFFKGWIHSLKLEAYRKLKSNE